MFEETLPEAEMKSVKRLTANICRNIRHVKTCGSNDTKKVRLCGSRVTYIFD